MQVPRPLLIFFVMKEQISDYYKEKGYERVYVVTNPEPRRVAILYRSDRTSTTMSYAKYVYTSAYREDIDGSIYHIDHINGDKMDDRIENLQRITGRYNRAKDATSREMVLMKCPVCGQEFLFPKRNLPFHPNPCCSRTCGGKKSHWK